MLLSGGNRLERALLALTSAQSQTGNLPAPFLFTATRWDVRLSQGNLVHNEAGSISSFHPPRQHKKGNER